MGFLQRWSDGSDQFRKIRFIAQITQWISIRKAFTEQLLIPNPLMLINNLRALFNPSPIWLIFPVDLTSIALAAFLLGVQVLGHITTGLLIAQDVMINQLMTDLDLVVSKEPAWNLIWAQFHGNLGVDQSPGFALDPSLSLFPYTNRHLVCLFGSITSLSLIVFSIPTDGRFVSADEIGDFRFLIIHFLQRINLVSLYLDNQCVGSYKCSPTSIGDALNLAVREGLILPQLTSFSAFKIALRSWIYDLHFLGLVRTCILIVNMNLNEFLSWVGQTEGSGLSV